MTSVFQMIFEAEKAKTQWKPCPFCGAKNEMPQGLSSCNFALTFETVVVPLASFAMIRCNKCNCNGPMRVSQDDALKAWNSRR